MASQFIFPITESLDELKAQLKQRSSGQIKERLQMLYWLKSDDLTTRQEIAQRLNRNESTIYRWVQKYKQGGLNGLLEVKVAPGPQRTISGPILEQLKAKLSQREGFSSYGAIQAWLHQTFGLEVPYSTVHRTVRYHLKAKLKVPRPRSNETDEAKQEDYKKNSLT